MGGLFERFFMVFIFQHRFDFIHQYFCYFFWTFKRKNPVHTFKQFALRLNMLGIQREVDLSIGFLMFKKPHVDTQLGTGGHTRLNAVCSYATVRIASQLNWLWTSKQHRHMPCL